MALSVDGIGAGMLLLGYAVIGLVRAARRARAVESSRCLPDTPVAAGGPSTGGWVLAGTPDGG